MRTQTPAYTHAPQAIKPTIYMTESDFHSLTKDGGALFSCLGVRSDPLGRYNGRSQRQAAAVRPHSLSEFCIFVRLEETLEETLLYTIYPFQKVIQRRETHLCLPTGAS